MKHIDYNTRFQKSAYIYLVVVFIVVSISLMFGRSATAQQDVVGYLEVKIIDSSTGKLTPARVRITRHGYAVNVLPNTAVAVMYGLWDHADGYGYQPDSSFYVDGGFQIALPPGNYSLSLSKGNEYLAQQHELRIEKGKILKQTYRLERWINTPAQGWYSADDHIHIRRSPREDSLLMDWIQAEDIHVGVLLRMGDFWETYYPQYDWGENGVYQEGSYLLTSGQEDPRTPELGHALGIGASNKVRFANEYYYYDKVFDSLHALGGLTGYAHQAETFHGYRGLTLDALRGKVDMLEILQFCVSDQPLIVHHYYHLLDLGIPVTAVAGSDFPWCGRDHDNGPPERTAQIGNARFYTYVDGPLTYKSWKAGVAAGHTFVSSGPVIDFKVNNALPGDQLDVHKRTQLHITAHAYGHSSQVPLQALEIIAHGQIIGRVTADELNQSVNHLTLEFNMPAERGIWIAARSYGGAGQAAHTTPVYITVDSSGFYNPNTVDHYLALSEQYLREIEQEIAQVRQEPAYQAWRYRDGLRRRIVETRHIISMMKKKYQLRNSTKKNK